MAPDIFRVNKLSPGSYTVKSTKKVSRHTKSEQVIVQVGSVTESRRTWRLAAARETVEVTAEAPQINYTSRRTLLPR